MADLIKKNDALISVQEHFNNDGFFSYQDAEKMLNEIMKIPSVDAALVVRCKDCKYSYEAYGDLHCQKFVHFTKPDDYCSHGERRPQ